MSKTIYKRDAEKNKKMVLKRIIIILAAFLIISTLLNMVMLKEEDKKYKAPGKLIDIDGHKMHIYSTSEGSPTVVMTCGSGTPCAYTDYRLIQPEVSNITRTCVYERPGYGWSEHSETPRDTEQIVEDLRRLLNKAGESPPYLFVAHSMGAMEVLLYSNKYPEEVEGIVLVDGTSPIKHIKDTEASIPEIGVKALRFINRTGLVRLITEIKLVPLINDRINAMPDDSKNIEKFMLFKNMLNDDILEEGYAVTESAKKMYNKIDLGNIPIIIITADSSLEELPFWDESQQSLLSLSTNSKQIIVKDASHISIMQKNADVIVSAIKELINKFRIENIN
ncbi:alpha/beta fold hydrolase [Abyssisolibacter fermentans]|uniref:alpha/beta fold hydrolase n=1 Tax=Abyssisolibacter fermentans TaxID=1766203 RepID=UPI00082BAF3E|nr:alpha/beta hydrolase [Abyssisolibacter fermentans]